MIMLRNREPLVSIVVPVYNVERYIDKCLDSLFSQSYENMQYIFVNAVSYTHLTLPTT